jgi:hypothetical protein
MSSYPFGLRIRKATGTHQAPERSTASTRATAGTSAASYQGGGDLSSTIESLKTNGRGLLTLGRSSSCFISPTAKREKQRKGRYVRNN